MAELRDSPIEESGVLKLFPTYVWASRLGPAAYRPINAAITAKLEALQAARPELRELGQWQTAQDLHTTPELGGLVRVILGAVGGICESLALIHDGFEITGCWANVSQRGYPHRQHIHPNNFLSGAYYVRTAPGADSITFHDPRPQAGLIVPPSRDQNRANPDRISLDVSEGMLVLFPAWLQHSVDPNLSEETRISVAFNVMFPSFGATMARPLWRGEAGG